MCYECFTSGLRLFYRRYKCGASVIKDQISRVTCLVYDVTCQVSQVILFISVKVAELVGGGSIINRTYPV